MNKAVFQRRRGLNPWSAGLLPTSVFETDTISHSVTPPIHKIKKAKVVENP